MTAVTVIHEGPFLVIKDIAPFITKTADCIFSTVPGTQGQLKLTRNGEILVSKNGKRITSVDFTRGTPVMIVRQGKHTVVIPKDSFEKIKSDKIVNVHVRTQT